MLCTKCGRREAFSAARRAKFAELGGPPPPPIPEGLCFRCAREDPALRDHFRGWFKELQPWMDRRMAEYVRLARELLARPLEAIDRFVDSLR